MTLRIDSAFRLISASPERVYGAFSAPDALERWLPPTGMTGTMLDFDFREGGLYRIRLTYGDPQQGRGKTTDDSDELEVRFTKLLDGRRIEQEITFESDDFAFEGDMRMIWTFTPEGESTLVTVRAENVPTGIRPEDHIKGLNSSLANLARYLESGG